MALTCPLSPMSTASNPDTSSRVARQCSVRAAIALNNMAVTLFAEMHCYRQAHCVLKDAIAALQQAISHDCGLPPLQDRLKRASQWILTSSEAAPVHKLPVQVIGDEPSTSSRVVAPLMYQNVISVPSTNTSATNHSSNSNNIVYQFLRIEASDYEEPSEDRVLAVACYNYAMSLFCHSVLYGYRSVQEDPSSSLAACRREKLLNDAARMLRLSSNLARILIQSPEQEVGRSLFFSLLIETTLEHVLTSQRQQQEGNATAQERESRLAYIKCLAKHLAYVDRLLRNSLGSSIVVAPAA
jgi:hypothetical protein